MAETQVAQNDINKIADLLISEEVKKINFVLDHVVVSARRYQIVASAIRRGGRIEIVYDKQTLDQEDAIAMYISEENKLILPEQRILTNYRGFGWIVHECTHVSLDAQKQRTSAILEEAAAFIAQIWYQIERATWQDSDAKSIGAKTLAKITHSLRKGPRNPGGFAVATDRQISEAWTAVNSMPGYRGLQYYHADGI